MNIQVFAANQVMKESEANVEVIALSEDVSEEILSEIGDNVIKGSVESAKVRYGDGMRSAILWTEKSVGNASSFRYIPNVVVADPSADYSISFKDESVTLCLKVSASIFQ